MKFRKMVTMTLYVRQQKRHRCRKQTFGLCGRRWGWRFDAWDRVLRAGALGWPWGMEWGVRWEGSSGWGTHIHPWLIHVNVWQKPLQYCKVISLHIKFKKRKKSSPKPWFKSIHSSILSFLYLPVPGTEPMSPAMAGGFLTTGPPRKSFKTLYL